MNNNVPDSPDIKIPPGLIYLTGLLSGLAIELLQSSRWILEFIPRVLGTFSILLGAIIMTLAFWGLHRAGTPFDPLKRSTALVTSGAYRMSRNPIYLALTIIYLGVTIFFQSFWALICLVPVLVIARYYLIRREELYLERTFGQKYLDYKAAVRRWL